MKNIKIGRWVGRLGNNIIQLSNLIQIALYYNYNIILPKHKHFNTTYIKINDKVTIDTPETFINPTHFFYRHRIVGIDKNLFNENINETRKILKECFNIKTNDITPLGSKDVVIHIRSSDIFVKPHPMYVLPPLSYYINIMKNINFDRIVIISDNKKNPCIDKLLQLYPNIEYKQKSLDDDIKLLLGAKYVIESFGTFTPSLLLFSPFVKHIYKPSYQFSGPINYDDNITIHRINLSDYHKKMGKWWNKPEQVELMMTY